MCLAQGPQGSDTGEDIVMLLLLVQCFVAPILCGGLICMSLPGFVTFQSRQSSQYELVA